MKYVDMGYLVYHYALRPEQWETDKYLYMYDWGNCILVGEGFNSIRKTLYPWYKANRRGTLTPSKEAIKAKAKVLWRELGEDSRFEVISNPLLEADDILAMKALVGYPIVTNDKDLLQLPEGCTIQKLDGSDTRNNVRSSLPKSMDISLTPEKYLLTLCLYGDVADNIPRLVGKGKKAIIASREIYVSEEPWVTAYSEYGSDFLDNLYVAVLPNPYLLPAPLDKVELYEKVREGMWFDYAVSMSKGTQYYTKQGGYNAGTL